MAEPLDIRVVRGDPTPEQEEAIREAILRMWRQEQAEARRASERSQWVIAARAEATGASAQDLRSDGAWRWRFRITGPGLVSELRAGRADSR